MTSLPHRLDRTVLIRASRETVFGFFTDSGRWAQWWGAGSTIEPHAGGRVYIRHPGGVEVSGEVVELRAPERLVFTYGYNSGTPIPAGSSLVSIRLVPHPQGTMLELAHQFADVAARDQHVQGWRFQLSLFANLVADMVNRDAASTVDGWFAAWNEPDAPARAAAISALAAADVVFGDRFSCISGRDELVAHLDATHRFMPGMRLERRGTVRHCQGSLLADWVAVGPDGSEKAHGTNLYVLGPGGMVSAVTGFWAPAAASAAAV